VIQARKAELKYVVYGEAVALQATAQHGQEVHEVATQIARHRNGAALGCDRGHALLPAPQRRLAVQALMRAQMVVLDHGDGEPALQLLQGQAGGLVAVVAAPLADIGEGRAGQAVYQAHQCADHPLDHAAELRLAWRAPVNGDAMLLATALERLGMELGPVVHANPARLALHRPVRLHLPQREPGRLVHGDVRQAQPDGHGGRGIQRDVKTRDAAALHVYGDREPGPADRLAIERVHQDQIHGRMIDLYQVEREPHGRCMAMHRLGLRVLLAALAAVRER